VIQSAINALTPDRTWKEKVALKGNFELAAPLYIPSYTILEIDGVLKAKDNLNDYQIIITRANNIDIIGGILHGNRGAGKGINIWNSQDIMLFNIYGTESQYGFINVNSDGSPYSERIFIIGCKGNGNARAGGVVGTFYFINNIKDLFISNCMAYNGMGQGFYFEYDGIVRAVVENSISRNNNWDGFLVVGGKEISLVNCIAEGNGGDGFVANGIARTVQVKATGCISRYNKAQGFLIKDIDTPSKVEVEGGKFHSNSQAQAGEYHGICLQNAKYVKIIGTRCFDEQTVKTQGYGICEMGTSDYNIIMMNIVRDNRDGAIFKSGANTKVKWNDGYVTENSGMAIIPAGSTYVDVSHGLAITPDINRIKVTPKDNLAGKSFWVSNVTSTTFRINISSADTVDHSFGWSYE